MAIDEGIHQLYADLIEKYSGKLSIKHIDNFAWGYSNLSLGLKNSDKIPENLQKTYFEPFLKFIKDTIPMIDKFEEPDTASYLLITISVCLNKVPP